MTVTNGEFSEGTGGLATGWTYTSLGTAEDYAVFSDSPNDMGIERFEYGWVGAELKTEFEEFYVDVYPADFEAGPNIEPYEDFEEEWVYAQVIRTTLVGIAAEFDSSSEEYEDFEEGYLITGYTEQLNQTLSSTVGYFDGSSEAYEDFEEGYLISGHSSQLTTLTTTAAQFDGTPEPYEDFEEDW